MILNMDVVEITSEQSIEIIDCKIARLTLLLMSAEMEVDHFKEAIKFLEKLKNFELKAEKQLTPYARGD